MGVRLVARSCWGDGRPSEGATYEFDQGRIVIGRGRGADVLLPHRAVSTRHATIEANGTRYTIVDHGATNGTLVEGARIVPGRPKPLRDGDRIEIGGFALFFACGVPVMRATSSEGTASLARRLVRETIGGDGTTRATLTILNGPSQGRVVELPEPPARLAIGRAEEMDIALDDADCSREHAEIEVAIDGVWVRDLASKNGILVMGRPVRERQLADRDEITVGATVLVFEDPMAAEVSALDAGEDVSGEPPRYVEPELTPAPTVDGDTSEPTVADQPALDAVASIEPLPAPPRRRSTLAFGEMVIYVLAAAVFAVSLLGLMWLLESG
ncbi:MAG: FHA domain-containing protein [Sandaracinaceae bacterium]